MLCSVISVHFLHAFQFGRNADFLRLKAEAAQKDGDVQEAIKQYSQYLKYRDDPQAYSELAELVIEDVKEAHSKHQRQVIGRAYNILEEAIRRHPELNEVRRLLVDFTMQIGGYSEALEHIKKLSDEGESSPALKLKKARCHVATGEVDKSLKELSALVGFDEQTQQFEEQAPSSAHEVGAFELLAQLLYRRPGGMKPADTVIGQLVAWNEDSAAAHLARARYLVSTASRNADLKPGSAELKAATDQLDSDVKAELDRSFELGPQDADVLLTGSMYAITKKDYARAQELLDRAFKEHPEKQSLYLQSAQLRLLEGDPAGAADQLKLGIKQVKDVAASSRN